jgi:hypothetical protein
VSTTTPTTEPTIITPGDTIKWSRSLADYPANDSWVLSYELINSANRYTVTAAASAADHLVTITAATSAGYAAGAYDWRARVTKSGEVYTVGAGRITVAKSFAAAIDTRSQARRTLEAIEATLEGRSTSATAEYEIAGRKLKYLSVPDLLKFRDRYRIDVAREDAATRAAAGLSNPGRIYVRHV